MKECTRTDHPNNLVTSSVSRSGGGKRAPTTLQTYCVAGTSTIWKICQLSEWGWGRSWVSKRALQSKSSFQHTAVVSYLQHGTLSIPGEVSSFSLILLIHKLKNRRKVFLFSSLCFTIFFCTLTHGCPLNAKLLCVCVGVSLLTQGQLSLLFSIHSIH